MASDGKTSPFDGSGGKGSGAAPTPKPSPNERMPGESPPGGPVYVPAPVDRGTGKLTPHTEQKLPFKPSSR